MARSKHDHWILLRLAAQNVGRRRLRAILLGVAVMLGVGIGFAGLVVGWALRDATATSFARMGADLVVVPRATLINITANLLTVQPTPETLPAALAKQIADVPGVAQVAPHRIVPALVDGRQANLIAIDPAQDFSVLVWLEERLPGSTNGLIAGGRLDARLGATLSVCGMPLRIQGRLARTGVGPFDEAYFLSFDALAELVSFCRTPDVRISPNPMPPATKGQGDVVAGMNHTEVCSPELRLDRVSAFLLQLAPGARIEAVRFGLAQLGDLKVVEGNGVLISSRQALRTLLIATAVFSAIQIVVLMILVSLMFSAAVQESYREIGLLRAMGAKPRQLMIIILTEAAIVTGLGGVAGVGFGAAALLVFARSFGFYFGELGVPFSWPPLAVLQASATAALVTSALIGLIGAFPPAWQVRRVPPHTLIHAGGR